MGQLFRIVGSPLVILYMLLFSLLLTPILDVIHYSVLTFIYYLDFNVISCDAPKA